MQRLSRKCVEVAGRFQDAVARDVASPSSAGEFFGRVLFEKGNCLGNQAVEVQGLWEFGEDGVEHFGLVGVDFEELVFAAEDDLDFVNRGCWRKYFVSFILFFFIFFQKIMISDLNFSFSHFPFCHYFFLVWILQ